MIPISQRQMKRLTAVHGWSGVVLGLLLFTVVITGTVAVFAHEIARWSAGSGSNHALDRPLDGIVRGLAETMPRFYLETPTSGAPTPATISGFPMHRHLIRDLFVAERPGARLVSARDRHVLASSWSLPFAIILAFTGSFFSFAFSVGFPIVAQVAFGGDREAMTKTLFEAPAAEDARPVRAAGLDAIRATAIAEVGGPLTFISVHNYGRADSRIHVWHAADDGRLGFTQTVFDGADGRFLGVKPQVGTVPSAGSALNALMWPLHVGDFAGLLSKAIWGALGATTCFVILSGLRRAG